MTREEKAENCLREVKIFLIISICKDYNTNYLSMNQKCILNHSFSFGFIICKAAVSEEMIPQSAINRGALK